jgi:hypothetical protein
MPEDFFQAAAGAMQIIIKNIISLNELQILRQASTSQNCLEPVGGSKVVKVKDYKRHGAREGAWGLEHGVSIGSSDATPCAVHHALC